MEQIFNILKSASEFLNLDAFVVGGFVRDYLLHTPSKDIDIVCVSKSKKTDKPGIALANAVYTYCINSGIETSEIAIF